MVRSKHCLTHLIHLRRHRFLILVWGSIWLIPCLWFFLPFGVGETRTHLRVGRQSRSWSSFAGYVKTFRSRLPAVWGKRDKNPRGRVGCLHQSRSRFSFARFSHPSCVRGIDQEKWETEETSCLLAFIRGPSRGSSLLVFPRFILSVQRANRSRF